MPQIGETHHLIPEIQGLLASLLIHMGIAPKELTPKSVEFSHILDDYIGRVGFEFLVRLPGEKDAPLEQLGLDKNFEIKKVDGGLKFIRRLNDDELNAHSGMLPAMLRMTSLLSHAAGKIILLPAVQHLMGDDFLQAAERDGNITLTFTNAQHPIASGLIEYLRAHDEIEAYGINKGKRLRVENNAVTAPSWPIARKVRDFAKQEGMDTKELDAALSINGKAISNQLMH